MSKKAAKSFEDRVLPELAGGLQFYSAVFLGKPEFTAENMPAIRANVDVAFTAALQAFPRNDRVEMQDCQAPGLRGAPDVPLRVYRPKALQGVLPCVYWIHGGGMIMCNMSYDDLDCQAYAERVGCVVVSVEYRLAPDSPQPALVEDCYAGLLWTAENAELLGIDPGRIAIVGRSGGGCLAAGTALMARDLDGPVIAYQLLIYPMLDDRNQTASAREFADVITWGGRQNRSAWKLILGDAIGGPEVSPYAAPARAANLAGLPPTLIQVGELEVFRDESIEYAQRLMQAGVACELHVYPGVYHGGDMFNPGSAVGAAMAAERYENLRAALNTRTSP